MNTQIYEEATLWLIKHREADLGSLEKAEFDTWLRESPQHLRAYLEMSALWETIPELDPSWNPTSNQLIARARSEGNVHPLAGTTRIAGQSPQGGASASLASRLHAPRSGGARFPVALVATLLVAVVGVAIWYAFNRNTYATDVGEQRSVVLADGSTVELNSRSRIRIRYTDARRDVDLLGGQALFRVTHNTARPFVVHSGTADVRAVGTQFDVYKKPTGTIVTVVEGRVAVLADASSLEDGTPRPGILPLLVPSPPAAPSPAPSAASNSGSATTFLAAGEQLTVPARPSRAVSSAVADSPQRADVAAATAWTHRTIVFKSAPLTEVAEEFNRYNSRQLVIADAAVASIPITGMFSSVDPALLLKFLRTQPELDVEETGTEIRISSR